MKGGIGKCWLQFFGMLAGSLLLTPPVSKREATRRKKARMPQKSDSSSDRGQDAFP